MTDPRPVVDAQRIPRRTLAVALAVFGLAVSIYRLAIWRVEVRSHDAREERVYELARALPQVVRAPGPVGLVFGSSPVGTGFDVLRFDARWKERTGQALTTFNLFMLGMNQHDQRQLVDRVFGDFDREGRRVALSVLEFTYFKATKKDEQLPRLDTVAAILAPGSDLLSDAIHHPEVGLRRLSFRYLFGGVNPADLRNRFSDWLDEPPAFWAPPPGPEITPDEQFGALVSIAAKLHPRLWDPTNRGGPPLLYWPETAARYQALSVAFTKQEIQEYQLRTAMEDNDVMDLRFSDALIDEYIAMCQRSARSAERTVLLISPESPILSGRRPEAARERFRQAIARIERACGLSFVNVNDGSFTVEDFLDPVHVNEWLGTPKYTDFVVDKLTQ